MDFTGATCVDYEKRGLPNYWLSASLQDQSKAAFLCRKCPLRESCTAYAQKVEPSCGVWHGQLAGEFITEVQRLWPGNRR